MKKKKKRISTLILLWILKSPFYLIRFIYHFFKKTSKIIKEEEIKKKRESITAKYQEFKIIKKIKGEYKDWISSLSKPSGKIGVILGARGTGKTAFGIKILENLYAKHNSTCFAIGFDKTDFPNWIRIVSDISEIKNNSIVLVDEGGILFNSRRAMSKANKILTELILVSRHKNLNILFISQNSSNLEVNILRQADFLALKPSSLLQKDFERKIIQKIYDQTEEDFKKFKKEKGLTYIYSDEFQGFISNPLPSFWKESISKSFK